MKPAPNMRSNFERRVYAALQAAEQVAGYEVLQIPYSINHTYTPDLVLPSGVVVELTGYLRPEKRAKLLAVREQYPDLDIRLVFQDATKCISRLSRTTYAMWAAQKGFIFAVGTVPISWFEPAAISTSATCPG